MYLRQTYPMINQPLIIHHTVLKNAPNKIIAQSETFHLNRAMYQFVRAVLTGIPVTQPSRKMWIMYAQVSSPERVNLEAYCRYGKTSKRVKLS